MATNKRTLTNAQFRKRAMQSTAKWKKAHQTSVNLTLNKDKDADILEWLEAHRPKQRYIRDLIRADMGRDGN